MTLRELMNKVETFNKLGEELGNTGRAYVDVFVAGHMFSGKSEREMLIDLRYDYDEENVNRIMDHEGYTVDDQDVWVRLKEDDTEWTRPASAQVVNYDDDDVVR